MKRSNKLHPDPLVFNKIHQDLQIISNITVGRITKIQYKKPKKTDPKIKKEQKSPRWRMPDLADRGHQILQKILQKLATVVEHGDAVRRGRSGPRPSGRTAPIRVDNASRDLARTGALGRSAAIGKSSDGRGGVPAVGEEALRRAGWRPVGGPRGRCRGRGEPLPGGGIGRR
jgi:hypothetical protein